MCGTKKVRLKLINLVRYLYILPLVTLCRKKHGRPSTALSSSSTNTLTNREFGLKRSLLQISRSKGMFTALPVKDNRR